MSIVYVSPEQPLCMLLTFDLWSPTPQEVAAGARLLKRVGFALLSAETDQFVEFLPDIQG